MYQTHCPGSCRYAAVMTCLLSLDFYHFHQRAELNSGGPMSRSIQIMGGSFRQGSNSKVVTFSARLAVHPCPCTKVMGKSKTAASYFCIPPSYWLERLYLSIQMKLYYCNCLIVDFQGIFWDWLQPRNKQLIMTELISCFLSLILLHLLHQN